MVCSVAVNEKGRVVSSVEVASRGCFFVGDDHNDAMVDELKRLLTEEIYSVLRNGKNVPAVKSAIQRTARSYFRSKYKRNPVVLPWVLEV